MKDEFHPASRLSLVNLVAFHVRTASHPGRGKRDTTRRPGVRVTFGRFPAGIFIPTLNLAAFRPGNGIHSGRGNCDATRRVAGGAGRAAPQL